jgi:hypothetical protein
MGHGLRADGWLPCRAPVSRGGRSHVGEKSLPDAGLAGHRGSKQRVCLSSLAKEHVQLGLLPGAVLPLAVFRFAMLRRRADAGDERADVARLLWAVRKKDSGVRSQESEDGKQKTEDRNY